jgi:hypothetical protein
MDLRDIIIRGGGKGGGTTPSVEWNDVTFIDYDGSVLYSYSLEEVQALTALPALPERDGLICQGWNWTLEEIKTLNCPVTVGAIYITDNGATRLHIRIENLGGLIPELVFNQTIAHGVSIDWGDGSAAETAKGIGQNRIYHTYAEPGDYVISLMPEDGCELSFDSTLLGAYKLYINILQGIYIGKNVTSIKDHCFNKYYSLTNITIPDSIVSIGKNAFTDCNSLTSIIIPNGITSIGNLAFRYCKSLTSIAIPNSITSIGYQAFQCCYSLRSITIPGNTTSIGYQTFQDCCSLRSIAILGNMTLIEDNVFQGCTSLVSIIIPNSITSIGKYAFQQCYSLRNITIPSGITSIGEQAFYNCAGMSCYDFSACTSVPTLTGISVFLNIQSDCKMLIPAALFDEWSRATNWTEHAKKMVAV